jgi:hypothetical protein
VTSSLLSQSSGLEERSLDDVIGIGGGNDIDDDGMKRGSVVDMPTDDKKSRLIVSIK